MAEKAKQENKNMIIGGICAAIAVVVIIIVAVALATRGTGISDDYFKSDGTKYVLTIENEPVGDDEADVYDPVKTHMVYTYSGEDVTGMKTYAEFADADTAKKAFDAIKESGEDMTNYAVEGKYIILTATPDQYEGMKASDVKSQIEFYESLNDLDMSESDGTEDVVKGEDVIDVDGTAVEAEQE